MITVQKNEKESSVNLLKRFKNKVRQSTVLNKAKNLRFKKRNVSKNLKKKAALKRVKKIKKAEELKNKFF